MKPAMQVLLAALGLPGLGLSVAAQDLKIVVTHRFGAPPGRETQSTEVRYVKGQRIRNEWRNSVGRERRPNDPPRQVYGPPMATIHQCDQKRVLTLNLRDREYSSHEIDEHGLPAGALAKAVPVERTGIKVLIQQESTDTGERQEMFGYAARRIVTRTRVTAPPGACARSSESETDGWYIDIEFPSDRCTPVTRGRASFGLVSWNCRGMVDEYDFQQKGEVESGFPLYLKQTSGGEVSLPGEVPKAYETVWVREVVEFSQAPLDSALFEVPKGYKQVAEVRSDPPMPFSFRVHTWWQRVRSFFVSLFS